MSRSHHLPAEERKAVTVETVVQLAGEHDPAEITTAAIASRMNLTQGALFRHFPSKEAIWAAVMEWVADRLLVRLESAANGAASPVGELEAMFRAHVAFVAAHPGVPRMMFGELQRSADTAAKRMVRLLIDRYGERLRDTVARGQAVGEIDSAVDSRVAATLFIGTIQGLVMQSLLANDVRRMEEDAPKVFAIYLRGLKRAP